MYLTLVVSHVTPSGASAQGQSPAIRHPTTASLTDGSRIVGELRPSSSSGLVLESPPLGRLTIPWDDVQQAEFGDQVRVTTQDGTIQQGTALLSDGVLSIQIFPSTQKVKVQVAEVVNLEWSDQPAPTWRDRVHAVNNSSLDVARGNTDTMQADLSGSMTYQARPIGIGIYGGRSLSQVGSASEIDTVADSARAGLRLDRYFGPSGYFFVSADFKHDRFQKVERVWTTVGSGRDVLSSEQRVLSVMGGLSRGRDAASRSIFPAQAVDVKASRTYWQLQLSASGRAKLAYRGVQLAHGVVVYRQLGKARASVTAESGRSLTAAVPLTGLARLEMTSQLSLPLNGWLSWQAQSSYSYTNRPYPGTTPHDLTLTTGLRIDFGNDTLAGYSGSGSNVGTLAGSGRARTRSKE